MEILLFISTLGIIILVTSCTCVLLRNLESIEKRMKWKPSKEQMDILHWTINNSLNCQWLAKERNILETLYNDLNQL